MLGSVFFVNCRHPASIHLLVYRTQADLVLLLCFQRHKLVLSLVQALKQSPQNTLICDDLLQPFFAGKLTLTRNLIGKSLIHITYRGRF